MFQPTVNSGTLRREISARNRARVENTGNALPHDVTFGHDAHVIYAAAAGGHGNFLPASFRRIVADDAWRRRLEKAYTGSARVPRAKDRRRAELECANSSDALLMNLFCYPGLLRRAEVCKLLGIPPGLRPEFGVRAALPMRKGEVDRTEIDARLGDLLIEAKLTEGSFGTASRDRLLRYEGVADLFEIDHLPWATRGVAGYQVIRGALAAHVTGGRFVLLSDARRGDLVEIWFRVLRAVRGADLRSRLQLCTWQELAACLPAVPSSFLAEKYGIVAGSRLNTR